MNIKWSPSEYKEVAVIAKAASREMLERLDWMTIQPKRILDMGCGVGDSGEALAKRYPLAEIVAIDLSLPMLEFAKAETPLVVCADATNLPLADQSIDMIFANFLFPWCASTERLLKEWRRLLRADGLLMFTALGPDTLQEYPKELAICPQLIDMHHIGDELLREGFADPVLDVSYYMTTFEKQDKMFYELNASGMINQPELTYLEKELCLELTYEVIYAHAFAPAFTDNFTDSEGVVSIPLSHLRSQLK